MASRPVKLKLLPRSTMKAKSLTAFPAEVLGGDGITVTKVNGVYTFSLNADTLPIFTSVLPMTEGDLLYAGDETTLLALHDVATGNALLSGGVGAAPAYGKVTYAHVDPTITGMADVRNYGAIAGLSLTNGVATAIAAIKTAGFKAAFLPSGYYYYPPIGASGSPQTPDNFTIIGEDWQTSIISVEDETTQQLYIGAHSVFRNVGIKSKWVYDTVPAGSKVDPVGNYYNTRDAYSHVQTFPFTPFFAYMGVTTAPGSSGSVTEVNGGIIIYNGSGGAFYISTEAAGYCLDLALAGDNDTGLLIRNGYGDAGILSNPHIGLRVLQYSDGTSGANWGIYFDRIGNENGSIVTQDNLSSISLTNPIWRSIMAHQTGNVFQFEHSTSTLTGDLINASLADGSGTFSGKFLNFKVNTAAKFTVDAAGAIVAAGASTLSSATPSTSISTGALVLSGGGLGVAGAGYFGDILHLANTKALKSRNGANSGDLNLFSVNSTDTIFIGDPAAARLFSGNTITPQAAGLSLGEVFSGWGQIIFAGSTSGTATLKPPAIAGSTTLTLPGATDTLIGKINLDAANRHGFTGTLAFSVAASALTIAIKTIAGADGSASDPVLVNIRSATKSIGTRTQVSITAANSIVVASGASLGHQNAIDQNLFVYAILNAGAIELAVSTKFFDPSQRLVSTTAMSGSATSATVMYSTTARTNVPFLCIGRVVSNQTTGGTWAATPVQVDLVPFDLPTNYINVDMNGVDQSGIATLTFTKLTMNHEVADPDNVFDSATNYRYQPNVAGKYHVTFTATFSDAVAGTLELVVLYKNGVDTVRGLTGTPSNINGVGGALTVIIDMNGTSDYLEFYVWQSSGSNKTVLGTAKHTFVTAQRIGS